MKDEYTAEDFARAVRNPYYGKFFKDGKYTVQINFADHIEIQEIEQGTRRILSSVKIPKEAHAESHVGLVAN
ncbi:MAG: hypothetical protein LBE35_08895 [Clostridiales bacterium]|nr:hypothetical protein [Clostridiales bacterium]